jgi:hypothetical protein
MNNWTIKKQSQYEVKEIIKPKYKLTEIDLVGCNIMKVSLLHNGSEYGNSGKGPFVKIKFENHASTEMYLNGKEVDDFTIEFRNNSERDQLVTALELILKELKND